LVESLYPNDELIIFIAYNILANILGYIGDVFSTIDFVGQNGLWMIFGLMVPIYLYMIIGYKTDLKRMKAEKELAAKPLDNINRT